MSLTSLGAEGPPNLDGAQSRCKPRPGAADRGALPHEVHKAQAELDRLMAAVTGINLYFDKLEIPADERPSEAVLDELREHARSAFWLPDRLRELGDCDWWLPQFRKVMIIVPERPAAQIIAEQGWQRPNRLEGAIDYIFGDDLEAAHMRDFHDRLGVQLRHGKRPLDASGTVSYTGRPKPGRYSAAYADSYSKPTGEVGCCHIDLRFVGARVIRDTLGIITNADLLTFDFPAFRAKFERYEVVALEQLGRFNANRRDGQRRRKFRVNGIYHFDRHEGGMLWRALAQHPKLPIFSTQQFIDNYGRGPFLHRLSTAACPITTPYL